MNFLRAAKSGNPAVRPYSAPASVQNFDFRNHLICFTAWVDGSPGTYILDTGAPQLLLNDRGRKSSVSTTTGQGAGGRVDLSETYVRSFNLSGRRYEKMWGLSLDLRPVERRLTRRVDGLVGYDLLRHGELRIDYRARTFQLRNSLKSPTHEGRAPTTPYPSGFPTTCPS